MFLNASLNISGAKGTKNKRTVFILITLFIVFRIE